MIIYIHGFGSSGYSHKVTLLRAYCKQKGIAFIAPSLSTIPHLAIQTLEELVESYDEVQLLGSSLGGYYALYLSKKYNLKAVLINPSIYPYITLKKVLDKGVSYYDGSSYEWNREHIEALKSFEVEELNEENMMLLLQKGDETLNYQEAIKKLPNTTKIVEEGGSHAFDGFERYFDEIVSFLGVIKE